MSSGKLKKAQYYVWYLGWKECRGLAGREFTESIVRDLLQRRSQEELPKLTIEVSKKELKIVQLVEKKKGKIDKVKYPSILSRDITYAVQALPPFDDVVACIYLGYNPSTKAAVHVHVYRCDSPDTAAILVNHLDLVIQIPDHQVRVRKIEEELARKGQISLRPNTRLEGYLHHHLPPSSAQQQQQHQQQQPVAPRPNYHQHGQNSGGGNNNSWRSNPSDGGGGGAAFTVGSGSHSSGSDPQSPGIIMGEEDEDDEEVTEVFKHNFNQAGNMYQRQTSNEADIEEEYLQQGFDSLAAELKSKLGKQPLLLPPKDYDTIHRKRGNTYDMVNRKCLNKEIVGNMGIYDSNNINKENQMSYQNGDARNESITNQGQQPLSNRGSQSSFGKSNSFESEELSSSVVSPRYQKKGLRRLSSGETNSSINDEMSSPTSPRPFSPGPFTKELQKDSYFPQNGPELPNYLQRGRGSYHSRQSSGDQSIDENDRRGGYTTNGSKYSASNLGIAPAKRALKKQQSSPEFRPNHSFGSGIRRNSQDEGYKSMDRYSSSSNTFNSNSNIDLGASMPAMKIKEFTRKGLRDSNEPARVYLDEEDPGAYIPIDYTVAARKVKERKGIP